MRDKKYICDIFLFKILSKNNIQVPCKYSQNVTCISKSVVSVNHILFECPITAELFQKNRYDFNAYNNVRDMLYNTDVGLC